MPFPEDLSRKAAESLATLGVHVKTAVMVKDIDRGGVTVERDGAIDRLESKTVIWAGGVTTPPFGRLLACRTTAETDRGGRIKVNADLTIPSYPDIYVVGDLALASGPNGKPLPGVAQVAMQGGTYAAKAIVRKVEGGKPLPSFKYFDKGELAVIGRAAAVANIFGRHISGLTAWFVWAFVHLMYIVQFRSRLTVFIEWAIEDLTFSRGARLITGSAATDFDFNKEMGSGDRRRGAA
jgi:NADH:ubiquinone reductase (H+-translocating)